jgi:hypothetical protein
MVRIRVGVLVVLGNGLELFLTETAVECFEGGGNLCLEGCAPKHRVLQVVINPDVLEWKRKDSYFPCSALRFSFFLLTFGVKFASLRDSCLYHANILIYLSQPSQISFDMEWNRFSESCEP